MSFVLPLATQDLTNYAESSATSNGIPTDYFDNFIKQESAWNPEAVSNKGAIGIVQIVPKWHPGVDPWDPYASIDYATKTIKGYYDQFGSWEEAFAAWNAGPGAVIKYGGVPPYKETQDFVKKIVKGPGIFGSTPTPTPTASTAEKAPAVDATSKPFLWGIGILLLILAFRNFRRG